MVSQVESPSHYLIAGTPAPFGRSKPRKYPGNCNRLCAPCVTALFMGLGRCNRPQTLPSLLVVRETVLPCLVLMQFEPISGPGGYLQREQSVRCNRADHILREK